MHTEGYRVCSGLRAFLRSAEPESRGRSRVFTRPLNALLYAVLDTPIRARTARIDYRAARCKTHLGVAMRLRLSLVMPLPSLRAPQLSGQTRA